MAITDIAEYTHLTEIDIEALGAELDAIRREVESSRGDRDARYIRTVVRAQRGLEVAARVALLGSRSRVLQLGGAAALAVAKIIENMELGHNIIHGQWDWMNDPEIHSNTWEWDMACPSSHWKHSHNYIHHKYTNVLGMDGDVGYGIMRVTRDDEWEPKAVLQPVRNLLLGLGFEWGIALHDLELKQVAQGEKSWEETKPAVIELLTKSARQVSKDYLVYPVVSGILTGPKGFGRTLAANIGANIVRNLWTYVVIFCGHFPDGAEKFTKESITDETQAEWYLRQMLGTANFDGGPVMSLMSGNLNYQIEHHLYPDLPSNRYAEIAVRVRALCDKYDIPYTTGPIWTQYLQSQRTIGVLALPDRWLKGTSDNARETHSERMFTALAERSTRFAELRDKGFHGVDLHGLDPRNRDWSELSTPELAHLRELGRDLGSRELAGREIGERVRGLRTAMAAYREESKRLARELRAERKAKRRK